MLKNISTAELKEGIQIRLKTNPETVRRYAETMEENDGKFTFPPLDVYQIDGELHIADGHHRWQAALAAGLETVPCFVHEGTEADLLATAFNGNSRNALQMTDGDLKHGREVAILKFPNKSDRELAAICKCSPATINRAKKELEEKGLFARPETVTGKDGKEYRTGDSVKHLKEKPAFNLDEFRQKCLEFRHDSEIEWLEAMNEYQKSINPEYEPPKRDPAEEHATQQYLQSGKKAFTERHKDLIRNLEKPTEDSIFLFSEWALAIYFSYFITIQNGIPKFLVRGCFDDGEFPKILCYTVQRTMTPAEYVKTQIEEESDEESTGPAKCNFLQEIWAGKVLEEYRRLTA